MPVVPYLEDLSELDKDMVNREIKKSLCAPDDYSTKKTQKYFKQFQSLTMIT
jgi:hypothetical protein